METMTIQKPNFAELQHKYSEDNILQIENLLNVVRRYNSQLMDDCQQQMQMIKNEDYFRDDATIKDNCRRFADTTQNKTYEIYTILEVIFDKLKPFFEVEGEFYQIEEYIQKELPEKH